MDYERFGICATIVIIAIVLGFAGIATNVELDGKTPLNFNANGAQTKSIDQIKADNIAENKEAIQKYCEALKINC